MYKLQSKTTTKMQTQDELSALRNNDRHLCMFFIRYGDADEINPKQRRGPGNQKQRRSSRQPELRRTPELMHNNQAN